LKSNVFGKLAFRKAKTLRPTVLFFLISALGIFLIWFLANLSQPDVENDFLAEIFEKRRYGEFQQYAQKTGAKVSYQVLKKKYPTNDAVAHDFAHVVGIVSFFQKGAAGIGVCDTAYNYGCYHGFIESFLTKDGVEAVGKIEKSCLKLGSVHSPSCLHGIGHGLMINSSYKLKQALSDCNLLAQEWRTYCWDGVFMERITGSMLSADKRGELTQNLDQPCMTIAANYRQVCWRNQVALWYSYYGQNSQKVASHCLKIDSKFWQTCSETIGLLTVIHNGETRETIVDSCSFENSQMKDYCLAGAIKELLFEGKSPELAKSLCSAVTLANSQTCNSLFETHFAEYKTRFSR